jgi:hypothetical protein
VRRTSFNDKDRKSMGLSNEIIGNTVADAEEE